MFISDQILLKLECYVDEYLYLSCEGTKLKTAYGKGVAEVFFFLRFGLHGIPSMFFIATYENDLLSLCETTNVFIDAY